MIEPTFQIDCEYNADIFNLFQNTIFAFDFMESIYWISDTLNNSSKKINIDIIKSQSTHKISLCRSMPLFAYIDRTENSVLIVDTQQSKIIRMLKIQDSKIESISISDDGSSILIGGKNGVLSNWDIYSGKILGIITRHKDFVLLSKESPNKRFIISVGYDRRVMLFDKNKDRIGSFVFASTSAIKCVRFFNDSKFLALGDISGYIYVIDTNTRIILCKFQAAYVQILDIHHYKDSYLFFLNSNGVLGVIDFNQKEKILDNFLPQNKYKSFIINNNMIILSSVENTIRAYNFDDFMNYCVSLIDSNEIANAYQFIDENKFLQSENFYLQLEARFEVDLLEAKALACSNNQAKAIENLQKYLSIATKSSIISNIISNIKGIEEFESLMSMNMEARAIPLVQKNPLLKNLKSYIDFNNRFSKVIILAKELIKKGKKDDANTLMMIYKKIPTNMQVIQEIFLYPHKVDEAIKAIEEKNYKVYFKLKQEYKFITYLQDSKEIEDDAQMYYFKCLDSLYSINLAECRENITILKNFKEYKYFATNLEIKVDEVDNLIQKINTID
ncbi:MAG: hypothetical protein K2P17_08260 [Helicobacteraceae bacterium]|nr:hypothetical protein [Helicobacteraceae bacterium]